MKLKTKVIFSVVVLLLFISVFLINIMEDKKQNKDVLEKFYQGPIPEGYDESYFRKTGITKPLENNE